MFRSIQDILDQAEKNDLPIHSVILQAEMESSGLSREEILKKMKARLDVMKAATRKGLKQPVQTISGMASGNAYRFTRWLDTSVEPLTGPVMSRAIARAMSVGEMNAGMHCIVATPTAGAAGVLPAVLLTLRDAYAFSDRSIINALLTAGGIGGVIMRRAHVSGAAGGCQAEVGSAAAMAAGAATELMGGSPDQSAQAVAIALQNMLGLVCDPVAGLVEVPCISRNAAGVANAMLAADLALAGVRSPIPADEVIDAMQRIGDRMDARFRETAQGGLAATPTAKRLATEIWTRLNPSHPEKGEYEI